MDCDNCKKNGAKEERNVGPIDQYYHEGICARLERSNKRWFIAWLVTFLAFIALAVGIIIYESQYEDVQIDATQTADTGNNYAIGGDFDGYAESQN